MATSDIKETVKISDPNKPGDYRVIAKSEYDKTPEAHELFSQYVPKIEKPIIAPPPPPPTRQTMEEFTAKVKGMDDAEVKTMAEGMNIEDGVWTREVMEDFIIEQETQSRYRESLVGRTAEELKKDAKDRGLTGWATSGHETLVKKIMEDQFKEETE